MNQLPLGRVRHDPRPNEKIKVFFASFLFTKKKTLSSLPVGIWLLVLTCMVFGMAIGGSHAREIGAGFAIQVWRPVTGFIPPLNAADWALVFGLFQRTAQYQAHPLSMAQFQALFWPMFWDRVWGRVMALVFLVPFVVFVWQGRIGRALALRLLAVFAAGVAEAVYGWFMVLTGREAGVLSPPPGWLAPHFALALGIFGTLLWSALAVFYPQAPGLAGCGPVKHWLTASLVFVAATMVFGALVAGTHAIGVYHSFPLMDGQFIPDKFWALQPAWENFLENQATVQFCHRMLASLTALVVLTTAALGLRADLPQGLKDLFLLLAGLVFVQFLLGMVTILTGAKEIGFIHGLCAYLLFATALTLRFHLRQAASRRIIPAGVMP